MRRIFLFLFLSLFLSLSLSAQDSIQARQYIRDLSSPVMHGRGYAYNGDSIAAQYIREQFQRIGLEPFVKDYYHSYDFDVYAMEGPVKAALDGKPLKLWDEIALSSNSKSVNESFNLLPITPKCLLDQDKLVKFLRKHVEELPHSLLYLDMATCKDPEVKKKLSYLFYTFGNSMKGLPVRGLHVGTNDIPVWSFSFAHQPNDFVIAYVKAEKITRKKSSIYLSYTNEFRSHKTQNVCAMIRGTVEPDTFLMVGGHYDHLGQMGEEIIFPGAHDNASGTAAVLDIAQYFANHPPYYTMIFSLFSGEEAGLLGSQAFVKDSLLDFSRIKMMLNIDLMGGGDDGFTMVNSNAENTKDFFQSMVDMNEREHLVKAVKPRNNANNSDHAPFVMKGVPAVFIYVMGGKTGGYHQPNDTNENCSLSAYESTVKLFIHALEQLAPQNR